MEINEAIAYVRGFAKAMREIGQRYAEENERSIAAELAFKDAEACETVCDALEAARNGNRVDVLAESGADAREGAR